MVGPGDVGAARRGGAVAIRKARVVGLDMLRGLTMVVMLLVDYTGDCYPSIGHADWDGLHLADFVMPFFLWVSGVSIPLSLRSRAPGPRRRVFLTALGRAARLFLLGLALQGGWLHTAGGRSVLHLDLSAIRWMGILQRIAIAYAATVAIELFVPHLGRDRSASGAPPLLAEELPPPPVSTLRPPWRAEGFELFYRNGAKWAVVLGIVGVGTGLTYGVVPPRSWPGCADHVYQCGAATCDGQDDLSQLHEMGCSGVGFLDTHLLGVRHTYVQGSSSAHSWPPTWGFDPEGLVTTLSALLPMFFGLHTGKMGAAAVGGPRGALLHCTVLGFLQAFLGVLLTIWVPFNKRLWSPSYSLCTSGCATLAYAALFATVDASSLHPESLRRLAPAARVVLAPLQWLGANCILFFVMSDCSGGLDFILRSVTWGARGSEQNVVSWFQGTVLMKWLRLGDSCQGAAYEQCGPAVMTFVWVEIASWMLICGVLYRKGIFWKV